MSSCFLICVYLKCALLCWPIKKHTDFISFFLYTVDNKTIPFSPQDLNTESSSLYAGTDHEIDVRNNAEMLKDHRWRLARIHPPTHLLLVKCFLLPLKRQGSRFPHMSPGCHPTCMFRVLMDTESTVGSSGIACLWSSPTTLDYPSFSRA